MSDERARRHVSKQTRVLVLERDHYRCRFCGATADESRLQVDHVMPWARGGTDTLDNLATLCEDCNSGKSDLYQNTRGAIQLTGTGDLLRPRQIKQEAFFGAARPAREAVRPAARQPVTGKGGSS